MIQWASSSWINGVGALCFVEKSVYVCGDEEEGEKEMAQDGKTTKFLRKWKTWVEDKTLLIYAARNKYSKDAPQDAQIHYSYMRAQSNPSVTKGWTECPSIIGCSNRSLFWKFPNANQVTKLACTYTSVYVCICTIVSCRGFETGSVAGNVTIIRRPVFSLSATSGVAAE